jgi:hypothetical protein
MLLEAVKFVWLMVLRKQKQNERRLRTNHNHINSHGVTNYSIFFMTFVGKI